MFGSVPLLISLRTCLAIESMTLIVFASRSLCVVSELPFFMGLARVGSALVEHAIELAHCRVAFVIAEIENFLQRDTDVWQILLDIRASVVFLTKMHRVAQVVRKLARA